MNLCFNLCLSIVLNLGQTEFFFGHLNQVPRKDHRDVCYMGKVLPILNYTFSGFGAFWTAKCVLFPFLFVWESSVNLTK